VSEPVNLAYLCHHYGDAYDINMRRGRYEARRRDDGTVLTADSAEDLLEKIREDYRAHPVPRQIAGAGRPQPLDCRFRPEG
jgi:hypothetical protein